MPKIKKMNLTAFYLLSFTWGIIMTVVGLFVLLFMLVFKRDDIKLHMIAGRICIIMVNSRFGGISLGIVYIVDSRSSYRLHTHELGHTVQNAVYGPLFPFIVGIPSVIRANNFSYFRARHLKKYGKTLKYDDIWFEGQATELGEAHFHYEVSEFLRKQKEQGEV